MRESDMGKNVVYKEKAMSALVVVITNMSITTCFVLIFEVF